MRKFFTVLIAASILLTLTYSPMALAFPSGSASPSTGSPDLSGKVVETMDSGGYTYAQIEKNGNKTWVAVPKTEIKKGQQITFAPGMPMSNFTSKTLKRTFELIYFSGGVVK